MCISWSFNSEAYYYLMGHFHIITNLLSDVTLSLNQLMQMSLGLRH